MLFQCMVNANYQCIGKVSSIFSIFNEAVHLSFVNCQFEYILSECGLRWSKSNVQARLYLVDEFVTSVMECLTFSK